MKTVDELTTAFREQGLRVTPQRQAIFRLLHGVDTHPTVESLYEAARTEMPTISPQDRVPDRPRPRGDGRGRAARRRHRQHPGRSQRRARAPAPGVHAVRHRARRAPRHRRPPRARPGTAASSRSRRSRWCSAACATTAPPATRSTPESEINSNNATQTPQGEQRMPDLNGTQDPRQPQGGVRGREPGQPPLPLLRAEGRRRGLPRRRGAVPLGRRR